MRRFSTPGVYYEHVDAGAPPVEPLRTDIAGLIGIARKGPLDRAIPIESWRQFQGWFGDVTGAGYLAYAARAFFECGGKRTWIVRVSSSTAAAAAMIIATPTIAHAWRVTASSPGVWGNDLALRVVPTHRVQTRSEPSKSTPEYTTVGSIAGFVRGSHVRVPVSPAVVEFRIVSFVDADLRRLYWIHPDPRQRSPWEKPLTGIDINTAAVVESVEYTLLVFAEGRLASRYDDLTLFPLHPRYGPAMVSGLPRPPADERGWRVPLAPPLVAIEDLRDEIAIAAAEPLDPADDRIALAGGADGLLTLSVPDFIGEPAAPLHPGETGLRGLAALGRVREVSLIAIPDIHIQPFAPPPTAPLPPCVPDPCLTPPPPGPAAPQAKAVGDLPPVFGEDEIHQVQAAMITQCELLHDRVAILDPPFSTAKDPRLGVQPVCGWRRRFDTTLAALYFPWASVSDPLRLGSEPTRDIPPSGHVLGYIAHSDLTVGVYKAPANGELQWLQDLTVPIDDTLNGVLNDVHVNALRAFPGRGRRIFGARTLSSDSDWRFLNVRRLMLMIEEALSLGCQWAVFEPNDAPARAKLHLSITSFLLTLWQKGALAGETADAAFFVRCDEGNNPAASRASGHLFADVGVATVTPFEFVVVRVGRVNNQFEIIEAGSFAGAVA